MQGFYLFRFPVLRGSRIRVAMACCCALASSAAVVAVFEALDVVLTARHARAPGYDHPMLGPLAVKLQRQRVAGLYHQALDLEALAGINRQSAAD